ncbi:hypothetical protein GALL_92120 [mine drainage metagenome]|uniref:Uncharacterized protein n=1 Tax=mine drainage metagenome TaxID=410659 RepID=A0A1J5SJ14_9ZZZZ
MSLKPAIEKSERWIIQCHTLLDGVSFLTSAKARVSVSLHHLSIEHHTGIHSLVDQGVYGSACALFRPQLEAYVRGAWYFFCATEAQIDGCLAGGEPPKFGAMIKDLEAKEGFDSGSLSRLKAEVWGSLNDYTHGGVIQIKARNTRDEIISRHAPEHIAGLITSSATLSFLAGVGIAAVANNNELAVRLNNAYNNIYSVAA